MNELDKLLKKQREEIVNIEVPSDLEERLHNALSKTPNKKRTPRIIPRYLKTACVFMILFIGICNIKTMAYYAKTLTGYNKIMPPYLQKLKDDQMTYPINKSHIFTSGEEVTLEEVILDENQMIIFYTTNASTTDSREVSFVSKNIEGMISSNPIKKSLGTKVEETSYVKNIAYYEKPYFYEKTFTWNFILSKYNNASKKEEIEKGSIKFSVDDSKRLKSNFYSRKNYSFDFDSHKIVVNSIKSTPTTTIIEGHIDTFFDLVKEAITKDMYRVSNIDMDILCDDTVYKPNSVGISTDMNGMTFKLEYAPIDLSSKTIEMRLNSYRASEKISQTIDLTNDNGEFIISNKKLRIDSITMNKNTTAIQLTTIKDMLLNPLYLIVDGKQISIDKVVTNNPIKGEGNSDYHTRTIYFPSRGTDIKLLIDKIYYTNKCNEILQIKSK